MSADLYERFFHTAFGPEKGAALFNIGAGLSSLEEQEKYYHSLISSVGKSLKIEHLPIFKADLKFTPVDVETFIKDPFFIGLKDEVYPEVLPYLKEINSGKYVEVVLTGGIGSSKTTLAIWTNLYQLYLLSALRSPHLEFGLDKSSEIEIIFQSITEKLAEGVDFQRFKELVSRSPYFQKHFPPSKSLASELHFPNRIIVKPVSGSSMATIGQNVIGGLIDELNYMAVVSNSKQNSDGGTYNQAVELYNSISRRRKSRFLKQGKLPGILCLVSSKKYPGQFTDMKMEEAKKDPTIYVYDKRVWDIKPDSFSKTKFKVFIGDHFRKPRILSPLEDVPEEDKSLLIEVPEDFRIDFERDIINALREIAGVSHLSKSPFLLNQDALFSSFGKSQSVFGVEEVDFVQSKLTILKSRIVNPHLPRFVHMDLALTGDSAGFAVGHVSGFSDQTRGELVEKMPMVHLDGVLEIRPPKNGEILFYKIREVIYALSKLGMNIRWCSLDSFQSSDTMQILRQKGYAVGYQSIDTSLAPYDFLKSALYDGRLALPDHSTLKKELRDLQLDMKTRKVDHLPGGSKDCADAVAGVCYGLTMRRETWTMYGISITQIPAAILEAVKKSEDKQKMKMSDTAKDVSEDVTIK